MTARRHAAALLAFALAAPASGQSDPRARTIEEGKAIAEAWCAACHVVSAGQAEAADMAPSFLALAADASRTDADLARWIADPHPPMPDPGLSRAQIEAVLAYIGSLRPR